MSFSISSLASFRVLSMSVIKAKSHLRKELLKRLESLNSHEISRKSTVICAKVLACPIFQKATSISIYLSMPEEVQTFSILQNILQQKKECYIPRFQMGGQDMEMVRLLSLEDYWSLPVNKWNIRQPPLNEPRQSVFENGGLDLVLVPGLGFTADGRRIGRGKGYYDRFLAKCTYLLAKPPITIGLAFTQQMLHDIPVSSLDYRLDYVINDLI